MKDNEKTKEQLVKELTELRSQNTVLEKTRNELAVIKIAADEVSVFTENIINSVREPLIALDQDLRVVKVSRSFYDFFKVKPEETMGQLIYELGNRQWDIPKLRELLETILPEKATFDNYEVEHDFSTIGKRTMLLNARQIQRVLGKEQIILLAIEDITERKLAEEKLRIAAIVESSKDAIIGKSLDGIITTWNKGAEEIYGYTKSEIIGKSISVLIPPELPDEMTEMIRKIKLGEAMSDYETVRRRKDGQDIYVSCTVSAIYDAEGRIVGASTIARDITERKQLENLLKESEMQYRLLFETANDGIVLIEKNEGKIAHINPSFEKMLGYSAKEVIGNKLHNVGLIIDNGDFQITMKKLNKEGILRYNDVPVKTQSGQDIYTDTYLVDKAKFAQCNIRDITERKKTEEQLQETLESLRRAVGATIQVLASAVETRDPYTAGHQIRSANLARTIAMEMGLPQDKIDAIRMAGSIHDIGKLSIPAEILSKPTKLSDIEFRLIKEHVQKGFEMLKDVQSPWPLAEIVHQHHERMDGSGYPRNLKGDDILIEARILAVADVVEAMASHRPYRAALGIDAALNEIEKNKGIFYDEVVADTCLRLFREKGFKLAST